MVFNRNINKEAQLSQYLNIITTSIDENKYEFKLYTRDANKLTSALVYNNYHNISDLTEFDLHIFYLDRYPREFKSALYSASFRYKDKQYYLFLKVREDFWRPHKNEVENPFAYCVIYKSNSNSKEYDTDIASILAEQYNKIAKYKFENKDRFPLVTLNEIEKNDILKGASRR